MKTPSRISLLTLSFIIAAALLYLVLLKFPQPFFSGRVTAGNLTVYYHEGRESDLQTVADRTFQKIKVSPLYRQHDRYRVFLTGSAAEYALYTGIFRKSAGFYCAVGNSFLRPSDAAEDRLFKTDGTLTGEDRPLSYYIAHETTHAMTHRRIGTIAYFRLPVWIREGIAEVTGRDKPDLKTLLDMSVSNPNGLSAQGGYLRYKLRAEYLLHHDNLTVENFLSYRGSADELDAGIRKYAANSK